MHHRPCISFPTPPLDLDRRELTLFMVRYMLSSGNAETPILFFDKDELNLSMVKAYTGDLKVEDDTSIREIEVNDTDIAGIIGTLTVMALNHPVGCILEFDNNNSLCIVGSGSSFYMIDLSNGLFYSTNGPEYDIKTYIDDYGSDNFKPRYFMVGELEEAKPAPKKKRKKVENKKTDQT